MYALDAEDDRERFTIAVDRVPRARGRQAGGPRVNGNGVLSGVTLDERAASKDASASEWTNVPLRWAWADFAQQDGDHEACKVLDATDKLGWAIGGHQSPAAACCCSRLIARLPPAAKPNCA